MKAVSTQCILFQHKLCDIYCVAFLIPVEKQSCFIPRMDRFYIAQKNDRVTREQIELMGGEGWPVIYVHVIRNVLKQGHKNPPSQTHEGIHADITLWQM